MCCSYLQYSRPYGRGQITAWASPTPLPLQILGLIAEAKKKKKKKKKNTTYTNEEGISSNSAILFVRSMYTQIHSVSSFNDDDFTKTVFIIRKDKEYLFTGSTVCVL